MMKRVFPAAVMLCVLVLAGNVLAAPGCFVLKDVSGGEYHTLATTEENTLWACGRNNYRQLGLGSSVYSTSVLLQVRGEDGQGFLEDILDFDAGWMHSLANDINGNIWSWGTDLKGQLGNGLGQDDSYFPARVLGVGGVGLLSNIAAVSAGRTGTHSLAVDSDGYVYAWGNNVYGQCGNGTSGGILQTPVLVLDDAPGTNGVYLGDVAFIIAVDAGVDHSIALDSDGYVWQWGKLLSISSYPEKVQGEGGTGYLENIIAVSSSEFSMALDENGNVWTWSSGYPEKVPGGEMRTQYLENIVAIGAGYDYKMALDSDGHVWQWDSLPVKVADGQMQTVSGYLENISVIDAGHTHKLAIDKNGTGWAWGSGSYGMLGTGSNDGQLSPAEMLSPNISAQISVSKVDNIDPAGNPNCVAPGDELIYTITVGPSGYDHQWVEVTDYLPAGVSYDYFDIGTMAADPNYSVDDHAYTWQLGPLYATDSPVVLQLTVTVKESAEPCGILTNEVTVKSNITCQTAAESTPVCYRGGDIIFVDSDKPAGGTGTSWAAAYNGLNAALARVDTGCGNEIWVAAGKYSPGGDSPDSFVLPAIPDGVSVYGGFTGNETLRDERDWKKYETILSGYISATKRNNTVVTMGDDSLLDGFTVDKAGDYAVYGSDADFTIENCVIADSEQYDGIRAENGNIVIKWCEVKGNGRHGVYHTGEAKTISLENCQIMENKRYGVYCENSMPTIKNSIIFGNGYDGSGFNGINIYLPYETPTLYNNTVVYNAKAGIAWFDDRTVSDPNDKDWPDIENCILWYNNDGGSQVAGFDQDSYASYCCIENCTEVNSNINDEPGFVLTIDVDNWPNTISPYYYHLAYNSPCKEGGSGLLTYTDQLDIDGEDRVCGTYADIGADELYSCDGDLTEDDIYNEFDWDMDGIVNYNEFAEFSDVWLVGDPNRPLITTDPNFINDPNYVDAETLAMWFETWDPFYNLNTDGDSEYMIDLADLMVLCEDSPQVWLWIACWKQSQISTFESMAMGGESMMMAPMSMSFAFEPIAVAEPEPVERSTAELVTFVEGIYEVIECVDVYIKEDHENAESLYDMKEFLEEVLQGLQDEHLEEKP